MDLICIENMDNTFAKRDSVIFDDSRVLKNLLELEHQYVPSCNYFQEVQTDIQPYMRKVVTTWMLEVCEEQCCEDQVLPLAINFLDRFLCRCIIAREQFQLLGATCLLIAAKIRQCRPLNIELLCAYTDNSVTPDTMKNFEILVLSKLQWNVTSVTGFDYVDHILERMSWCTPENMLRRHAHTLVAICYTELEFIQTPPSLIAAGCICNATRGLNPNSPHLALQASRDICSLTLCDPIALELVVRHVQRIVDREAAAAAVQSPGRRGDEKCSPEELLDSPRYGQPETPTDLQDVYL